MRDLQTGKLSVEDINARVKRILGLISWIQSQDHVFEADEKVIDTDYSRALLREAAASAVVILKNDAGVLPIRKATKIAVIGPNARSVSISGGGSAAMLPSFSISPLDGIARVASEIDAEVHYALGTLAYTTVPLATPFLRRSEHDQKATGWLVEFWKALPAPNFASTDAQIDIKTPPDHVTTFLSGPAFMIDNLPADILTARPFIRVRPIGTVVPRKTPLIL